MFDRSAAAALREPLLAVAPVCEIDYIPFFLRSRKTCQRNFSHFNPNEGACKKGDINPKVKQERDSNKYILHIYFSIYHYI